jgi:hydrogenase-4 component D
MGIGNPLRGDDAVGSVVARLLRSSLQATSAPPLAVAATVLDAEEIPESWLGPAVAARPDTVLLIDAVELAKEPGAVALLPARELGWRPLFTHRTPLRPLTEYLENETGAEVTLLGVQPGPLRWGETLSPPVSAAAADLALLITEVLASRTAAAGLRSRGRAHASAGPMTLLALVVLLPVAGAIVAGLLPPARTRAVAVITSLAVALLAIAVAWLAYPGGFHVSLGGLAWLGPARGQGLFGLLLDPLSTILLIVVTVIGFLTVLYSTKYLREKNRDHAVGPADQGRYYFWLLAFLASMAGVATSPNFLQLFVLWELTTICSWALISFNRSDRSLKAGFKAILMTHAGGLFFLLALLVLFARTGSFGFDALARLDPTLRGWVYAFLLIAASAKAAQVPFHTWLPDAMEAPTPISAYLHAAAMVKAGVYLMLRAVGASGGVPHGVGVLMAALALTTMLVALSFYFVQDDLKRLLAYSTIAHLGYIMLGAALGALGASTGFQGGALHVLTHGFSKATLFLCVGAVAYITGSRSIRRWAAWPR